MSRHGPNFPLHGTYVQTKLLHVQIVEPTSLEMSPNLLSWMAPAQQQEQTENPLNLPVEVALQEAVRAAFFLKNRWIPEGKLPGFGSLPGFSLSMVDELLSLVRAIQEAQFFIYVEEESSPKEDEPPEKRIKELLSYMGAALAYLLTGPLPELEAERIKKIQGLPEQKKQDAASLSLLLRLYIGVCGSLQKQLSGLGESFDLSLIEEARAQLAALEQRTEEGRPAQPKKSRQLYYQLLSLLQEKVGRIRAAAGFLYGNHKKILRQVTSAYDRSRRQKARQAKKKSPDKGAASG